MNWQKTIFLAGCTLVVGCSEAKSDAPQLAAGELPALGQEKTTRALSAESPVAIVRESARRVDSALSPFLKRQLTARGEARLWAAFGLGKLCKTDRPGISAALIAGLSSWALDEKPPSSLELETLARSLGACGSEEAERVLRSWINPSAPGSLPGLGEAAAWGLGALADRTGRLEERTLTVLLDAAEHEKSTTYLYPLARLPLLSEALSARTLDVAGTLVVAPEQSARGLGVLALGSAGPSAALPLAQLILKTEFAAADRALAVQALSRLGEDGARVLDQTLKDVLERGLPRSEGDENWLVLNALIKLVDAPRESRKLLAELSQAPLSDKDSPGKQAQRLRMVSLRCRAADLVAGTSDQAKSLLDCDPEHGEQSLEARLRVLERSPLKGRREKAFDELARSGQPRLLQAALRALPRHPEFSGTRELLAYALEQPSVGSQATALQVVAAHPDRAHTDGKEPVPEPRIVSAITKILDLPGATLPLETVAAALSATGALGVMTLKAAVEKHCEGPHRALWPRAESALALLGNPGHVCGTSAKTQELVPPPSERHAPAAPALELVLETDLGELTLVLDTPDTEQARARLVELVKKGHYDGARVTAVAFGFAISWGDSDGDGYENGDVPALDDELGPSPWHAGSFGLTSFAPGAAATQLLVTVSEAPQMTGEKTRLGSARGPFALLVPGDVLRKVRLR